MSDVFYAEVQMPFRRVSWEDLEAGQEIFWEYPDRVSREYVYGPNTVVDVATRRLRNPQGVVLPFPNVQPLLLDSSPRESPTKAFEQPYLDLLRRVLDTGERVETRAKLASTGQTVAALSLFGEKMVFDLAEGFPLVTTKQVNFDAIFHELAWFLRGDTNIQYLNDHKVHIWDDWADEDGDLGSIYGHQWRHWGGDQIATLVQGIMATRDDPNAPQARRLILSAWNVADLDAMALPPCHVLSQFLVRNGRLHCQLYQRSCDLFIGSPYNFASYALLTHLLARATNLGVGTLHHVIGDAHIYENHFDQVREQLNREPYPSPTLRVGTGWISDQHRDRGLGRLRRDDVELVGYRHHPALRGEVAV